jgi:hypothetical protein
MHKAWFMRHTSTTVVAVLWLVAVFLTGCEDGTAATSRLALVVGPSDAADSNAPHDYPSMCRHYCHELEQTLFYGCVGSGGSTDGCVDKFISSEDQCFQGRCVPQLVQPTTCLRQCDGLGGVYDSVCPPTSTDIDLCPLVPALHDQTCRDGCVVDG